MLGRVKAFRRICICLIVAGALLLFARRDSSFDTVPFPAVGLTVKMLAKINTEGDYHLIASMPKADQAVGLAEESVPCSLAVSFSRSDKPSITNEVTSLSRYAEFGFGRIQFYKGGEWHLNPGEYAVEISSREECRAALARGATLSLEQKVTHITERFLTGLLVYWSGVIALCGGVLGVILCEFKQA
jgi:hypothetical protein